VTPRRVWFVTLFEIAQPSHLHHGHCYNSASPGANTLSPIPTHKLKAKDGTMGIKNLYQIISENAPDAIKTGEIKNQFGRKVAIDA
jgi:hypothetical protein